MSERMKENVMKTIKKNKLRNILTVVLLVLFGTMQATAVEYKNQYKVQRTMYNVQGIEAPSVAFQSTSAYSVQWNQDEQQSVLNEDGTVNAEAYGIGRANIGPRRAGNPGTPGDDEEEEGEQQPLGSTPWLLLLLLSLAYGVTKKVIIRKAGWTDNKE